MAFPFLTIFLIFLIVLNIAKHSTEKKEHESKDLFWQRENASNAAPKKDISSLNYIYFSLADLPAPTSDPQLLEEYEKLRLLSDATILNLTGYSNTDLKLNYGASNLSALIKYDQNFTQLCQLLNRIGDSFYQLSLYSEAIQILEFAVACQSDISGTYRLLAQLYAARNQQYRISDLIARAQNLNSLSREIIIRHLEEFVHTVE